MFAWHLLSVMATPAALAEQAVKTEQVTSAQPAATTIFEGESFFKNVRQLTFGGQNAEAYFSHDASMLVYQATVDSFNCDQIFTMNADGSGKDLLSTGLGRTTCAFIAPDGGSIIYCSTHLGGEDCPPEPDMSQGYVWALYDSYDIFKTDPDGGNIVRLTDAPGYDAEAVYSPKGDRIVFTSDRTGDLEIFLMNPDGSSVEQLTDRLGYDGGAFFSFDGEWICYRASRPEGESLADYQRLLKQGLIRPSKLDLYIMNLSERKPIRLTDNSAANFGPYFHPDGKHIIFCSNLHDPETRRRFDLFLIDIETKEIRQVTNNLTFDGFPMFSHDGTKLVFASNRDNKVPGETNIFIADWVWPEDE
jgi:Tol biopolymer transport system component